MIKLSLGRVCCGAIFLMCLMIQPSTAQKRDRISVEDYINTYKDIAIREMDRTGIPASITLAQGIHESGVGNSRLATEANNHFGIKCGGKWEGETYYKWDDESTESCFRVYDNPEASYLDHSAILQKKRYAFLFEYDKTDYEKWAKGLRKAGYATDPKYPQKLIKTIEQHQLAQYDLAMPPIVVNIEEDTSYQAILENPKEIFVIPEETERRLRRKRRSFLFKAYKKGIFRQNGASYVLAKEGETALDVATRMGIPYRKFLRFNDLVDGDQLIAFQPCYIQPKRSRYRGDEEHFKVTDDISMYEIAQYFGIKLEQLSQRNLLKEGEEPRNGELIMLNQQVSVPPAIRLKSNKDKEPEAPLANNNEIPNFPPQPPQKEPDPIPSPPLRINEPTYPESVYKDSINTSVASNQALIQKDSLLEEQKEWLASLDLPEETVADSLVETPTFPPNDEQPSVYDKSTTDEPSFDFPPEPKKDSPVPVEAPKELIHVVKFGETLYSIGRLYNIPWKEIKNYNQLRNDVIKEKQVLKIPKK